MFDILTFKENMFIYLKKQQYIFDNFRIYIIILY